MRTRTLLLSALALALASAPAPALAESDYWDEEEVELVPARPANPRRHARPLEGGGEEPEAVNPAPMRFIDDEDAPGSRRSAPSYREREPAPRPRATEAREAPRARPRPADTEDDWDRPSRRRRSRDSDYGDDLRRSADHLDDYDYETRRRPRRTRTAEEELYDGVPELDERMAYWDEPGIGLAAELHGGVLWLDHATGGTLARFTMGLNVTWQLGRQFAPENDLLYRGLFLEGTYLYSKQSEGTKQLRVDASYHYLSAAVLAGYPFKYVLAYAKFGPSMTIMPMTIDVQGGVTDLTGVKGGVVYGIGARTSIYLDDQLGVAGRVELIRYRRQYLDDTLLVFGAGMSF